MLNLRVFLVWKKEKKNSIIKKLDFILCNYLIYVDFICIMNNIWLNYGLFFL